MLNGQTKCGGITRGEWVGDTVQRRGIGRLGHSWTLCEGHWRREGKEWSLGVRGQWGRGVVRLVGGACERGPIDVRGGA